MKLLIYFALISIFYTTSLSSEIDVRGELIKTKNDWQLKVIVKNNSMKPVSITCLRNKEWMSLRLDLWSSGKGIELYSKENAEWQRHNAFVLPDSISIPPGKELISFCKLKEMSPSRFDNDELAKAIIENLDVITPSRGYISLTTYVNTSDPNKPLETKFFVPVKIVE